MINLIGGSGSKLGSVASKLHMRARESMRAEEHWMDDDKNSADNIDFQNMFPPNNLNQLGDFDENAEYDEMMQGALEGEEDDYRPNDALGINFITKSQMYNSSAGSKPKKFA